MKKGSPIKSKEAKKDEKAVKMEIDTEDEDDFHEANEEVTNPETGEITDDSAENVQDEETSNAENVQEEVTGNAEKPVEVTRKSPEKFCKHQRIELKDNGRWERGVVLGQAGKKVGKYKHWYNVQLDSGKKFSADFAQQEVRKESTTEN